MGFFSCGFKFELSSYGTCKEVIKTSRVQVRRKKFFEKASLVVASLVVVCLRGFAGKTAGPGRAHARTQRHARTRTNSRTHVLIHARTHSLTHSCTRTRGEHTE